MSVKAVRYDREIYLPHAPSDIRYGVDFGLGETPQGQDKKDYGLMTAWTKALAQAWANGCPIPYTVINRFLDPEVPLARYENVNEAFLWIISTLLETKGAKNLALEIATPVTRLATERGYLYHEPANVPASHRDIIHPLPANYGLPRTFLEIARVVHRDNDIFSPTMIRDSLLVAARPAQNRLELQARLSEQAVMIGVPATDVLRHTFGTGPLSEQRNYETLNKLFGIIQEPAVAPQLAEEYRRLSRTDQQELHIVHFRQERNPDTGNHARFTCRPG